MAELTITSSRYRPQVRVRALDGFDSVRSFRVPGGPSNPNEIFFPIFIEYLDPDDRTKTIVDDNLQVNSIDFFLNTDPTAEINDPSSVQVNAGIDGGTGTITAVIPLPNVTGTFEYFLLGEIDVDFGENGVFTENETYTLAHPLRITLSSILPIGSTSLTIVSALVTSAQIDTGTSSYSVMLGESNEGTDTSLNSISVKGVWNLELITPTNMRRGAQFHPWNPTNTSVDITDNRDSITNRYSTFILTDNGNGEAVYHTRIL